MSTTSNPRTPRQRAWIKTLGVTCVLLALGACIQGPWDYYPDNPPPFRGVFLTGYALAGRPLAHVCFERVLDLDEEATEAFAFYDSADVRVTGPFSDGARAMALTAMADTPNCFKGDSLSLVQRGGAYSLAASLTWDSAGHRVTSVLTSEAHVPDSFSIRRTARAPSLVMIGGAPANILNLAFIKSLRPDLQLALLAKYDSLGNLLNDSAGLSAYLQVHGIEIKNSLVDLLSHEDTTYHEGDTVYYLNGALNTLSHYFTSDRSADVGAVLITQRFDPQAGRPETRFDRPLGLKPDSGNYYFPGDVRRLLIYPNAKGRQGWNLLDSLGVVNTWFMTGRNRLYFYGAETAYMDFLSTNVQIQGGGGPGQADIRIKRKFNVKGGIGVFAGAIPDSFDVFIRTDTLTKVYSLPVVHADYCRDKGWLATEDCRGYYRSYCAAHAWKEADCYPDAVVACLEAAKNNDTALAARCSAPADSIAKDTSAVDRSMERFCVETDFPPDQSVCAAPAQACLQQSGANPCKRTLWDYCKDNLWHYTQFPQCGPGLVSYCKDNGRPSEVLCSRADAYCKDHPDETACK